MYLTIFHLKNHERERERKLLSVEYFNFYVVYFNIKNSITIVRTQFLCGPIMMLGSHMKDPSQYDLQRVGLKSQPLVTERCPVMVLEEFMQKKGVGLEHLSPKASHPMGWDSSELIRGPLRSYSGYPMMDFFSEVRCC